jgi:hypothetical protein
MSMKVSILIAFVFLFISCKSIKDKNVAVIYYARNFSQPVEKVSFRDVKRIMQLDGQFVEMEGIFRYAFEDVALYPTKTAGPPEGMGLDLRVPSSVPDTVLYEFDEKNVVIVGKVNLKNKGHYSGYIGTLDSAFCIKKK